MSAMHTKFIAVNGTLLPLPTKRDSIASGVSCVSAASKQTVYLQVVTDISLDVVASSLVVTMSSSQLHSSYLQ